MLKYVYCCKDDEEEEAPSWPECNPETIPPLDPGNSGKDQGNIDEDYY